jgi:hypothetical protein
MKRLVQTSLPLLLVLSSLGHVFAAALCPAGMGRECCFLAVGRVVAHSPAFPSQPDPADHCAAHSDRASEGQQVAPLQMDGMELAATPTSHSEHEAEPLGQAEEIAALSLPEHLCPHCVAHSGPAGLPLVSVAATDQVGKSAAFLPLPVARFLIGSIVEFRHQDSPREHAPPGNLLPRYLVVHVFLI